MTQIEFENQLRQLRAQKDAELTVIAKMQGEVKEEIAAIDRQVKELRAKREKLNQQRIMIANRRFDMEREWGRRINEFYDQNYTTSRELENVSEWAIARELRRRGYSGTLANSDKEYEFMSALNAKLNGTPDADAQNDTSNIID